MLPGRLSLGATYPHIPRQTSGYALGIGVSLEERVGCAEAMEPEGVFS